MSHPVSVVVPKGPWKLNINLSKLAPDRRDMRDPVTLGNALIALKAQDTKGRKMRELYDEHAETLRHARPL